MGWFENLKRLKIEAGMTTREISEKSGLPEPTLEKIFSGTTKTPGINTVQAIVHSLGYTLNDIDPCEKKEAPLYSSEAEALARDYDGLDTHGKKAVRAVADVEKARCVETAQSAPAREADTVYYITSWFAQPMSAGTGQPAGDNQPNNLRLIKEPPRGTSYVAPISGDSMEPTYHDGDKLFIHACEEIALGQIGVFYMDGQQWVKELGDGELISHSPTYPPRPITDDIRCQGLVLGVCDDSYLE